MSAGPSPTWVYLEQKFVGLGHDALSRARIYLDTNFWAMLRDHEGGRKINDDAAALLRSLREVVEKNIGFCTFSAHTLSELMKHKDASTRQSTAHLMDELSGGVCLANQERLFNNELISFVSTLVAPTMDRWSLSHLAWAKPFFIFLDYEPPSFDFLGEDDYRLRTGFIDHVWSMPMEEVVKKIDAHDEPFPQLTWPKAAALSINSDVRKFDHENKTIHEMYLSELNGLLEFFEPQMSQRYVEFVSRYQIGVAPVGVEQYEACGRVLRVVAMQLARERRLSGLMPGTHVSSMMHAAIRFDKGRKFKANDLMDIEHAEAALPHCSMFFTDGPNAHLIRSAKLDTEFGCVVCGGPKDAEKAVIDLLNQHQ